jgi:hypothetical protein
VGASIAMDPTISAGVQYNTARKKNSARNIASRSKRNTAGMTGVTGATVMIPGCGTVPDDLTDGAKLFLRAAKEAIGCSVTPKDMTYLLNFDEFGRWVWAGNLLINSFFSTFARKKYTQKILYQSKFLI